MGKPVNKELAMWTRFRARVHWTYNLYLGPVGPDPLLCQHGPQSVDPARKWRNWFRIVIKSPLFMPYTGQPDTKIGLVPCRVWVNFWAGYCFRVKVKGLWPPDTNKVADLTFCTANQFGSHCKWNKTSCAIVNNATENLFLIHFRKPPWKFVRAGNLVTLVWAEKESDLGQGGKKRSAESWL